jgi:hypothetical protein
MISKPSPYGWASWELPNFTPPISYIDDFPEMLLSAFLKFFCTNTCQEVEFDAEGYFYTIYIGTPVYARIDDDDCEKEPILICDTVEEFVGGVIDDIEEYIDEWASFSFSAYFEEKNYGSYQNKNINIKKLENQIDEVMEAMVKWKKS